MLGLDDERLEVFHRSSNAQSFSFTRKPVNLIASQLCTKEATYLKVLVVVTDIHGCPNAWTSSRSIEYDP